MRKKSGFQEVWGRADGARAELGIPLCVCESQGRAGSRSSGLLGMLRNTQCYQSDPRDMSQLMPPKKGGDPLTVQSWLSTHVLGILLQHSQAGAASLPSEQLQHLDMGTWLPGKGCEGVTSAWSFLCRFSSEATLKEGYMDLLLTNRETCPPWMALVMWHQELDWLHGQEWNGGWRSWDSHCCCILLAFSRAPAQKYSPKSNHQQMIPLPQQQHWGCSVNSTGLEGLWSIFQLYIQLTSFFMLSISTDILN